jgi:hypothetical protein
MDLPGNRHQFAERIDKDVIAASLSAEKTFTGSTNHNGQSNLQRPVRKSSRVLRNGFQPNAQVSKTLMSQTKNGKKL